MITPIGLVTDQKRRPEARPRPDAAHEVRVRVGVVEDRVHASRRALAEDAAALRTLDGQPVSDELLFAFAVGGRDLEPALAGLRQDGDEAGVDELAHPLDDQVKEARAGRCR